MYIATVATVLVAVAVVASAAIAVELDKFSCPI